LYLVLHRTEELFNTDQLFMFTILKNPKMQSLLARKKKKRQKEEVSMIIL
jgi:hypothetical protein